MRKATIYQSYEKWDDYSLSTLAGRTLAFMTGNLNFPDPRPAMDDYTVIVNDYREKHEIASKRGSQLEIKAKDNARALVLQAMKELSFYVNTIAKGDGQILASSGFELVPPPQSTAYPDIPKNLRLSDGRVSGELRFMFGSLRSAWEYEYQYATALDVNSDPEWGELHRTTNSRGNYISGLTAGERCYVRVRARNGKGTGDWSEAVSIIVR